jgi:hypothetical protein
MSCDEVEICVLDDPRICEIREAIEGNVYWKVLIPP